MTDNNHPITPPPELVQQWINEDDDLTEWRVAIQAARWGADQELDACCKALEDIWDQEDVVTLNDFLRGIRSARRPKPPSLKEQAQRILVENGTTLDGRMELDPDDIAIIRRALESLPN